jgi:hypothetical protein
LRNLVSGRSVAASQVTAVVERSDEASEASGTTYLVRLRARLVAPYFVRLTDPVVVSDTVPLVRWPTRSSRSCCRARCASEGKWWRWGRVELPVQNP